MVKTYNDGGRFLLVVEPVDDEALVLIKKIKAVCGIDAEEKPLEGLMPPVIPNIKSDATANTNNEKTTVANTTVPNAAGSKDHVGAGYKAYLEAVMKIKKREISGDERAETLEKVNRFAESMKTRVPTGATLRFCIENLSDMFSERIENKVLDEMKISKEQLLLGDENLLAEAYKIAVTA